ncbi:hypothetical protein ElyMa_003533600 [Elysia marginata]|uniref:G-protein coupled receptors family 1 profile domain-containing protein n=1 Tax=Elysia marginata TaxID=1093978 RepID=A0AAV4EIM2_9GAST|nr:hypothetical protein ElyMa_003533600 [Elysia marginata]
MAVLTGTCYYYVIYMYGPNYHFGIVSCSAWVEVTQDVFILMALDTVFACGVPCVILIVLVILIFARGCEYYRISSAGDRAGQGRFRDGGSSRRSQGAGFAGGATLRSFRAPRLRNGASASSATTSSSSSLHAPVRVTNVIFPVVGMTLILQFPTFAFRFMFSVFKLEREVLIRLTDYQPLFIYMNNLAWAIKFYIYLISSPSFRRRTKSFLVGIWHKIKASGLLGRRQRQDSMEEREEVMAERGEGTGSRALTNRPINMAERWENKKSYTHQRTAV